MRACAWKRLDLGMRELWVAREAKPLFSVGQDQQIGVAKV
jgi:hypothetical protein